jgi:hypothetical protein
MSFASTNLYLLRAVAIQGLRGWVAMLVCKSHVRPTVRLPGRWVGGDGLGRPRIFLNMVLGSSTGRDVLRHTFVPTIKR